MQNRAYAMSARVLAIRGPLRQRNGGGREMMMLELPVHHAYFTNRLRRRRQGKARASRPSAAIMAVRAKAGVRTGDFRAFGETHRRSSPRSHGHGRSSSKHAVCGYLIATACQLRLPISFHAAPFASSVRKERPGPNGSTRRRSRTCQQQLPFLPPFLTQ